MTRNQKYLLAVILILAAFFRFYLLFHWDCGNQCSIKDFKVENLQPGMPGGLFPDEAANGLDINSMQKGVLQPFYERGNGREALFFYMLWGSVELFGKGAWQHHLVSALVGLLSVFMCFLVTKKLFSFTLDPEDATGKHRAVNIALLATFLMAVNSWHIVLSRTAFRAILIPLFASLTFYFLLCTYTAATNKKKLLYSFLTGASFALGFYTYIAFRIMAPILFMVLLWPLFGALKQKILKAEVKTYFWPAVSFLVAFVIFFYPIGKYFYQHPGSFVGRAGQVSIFNQELYTVNGVQLTSKPPLSVVGSVMGEVFKTQMLGFFFQGDLNWRQNVSGYPFLSPLVSPFFAVALLAALFFAIAYFFAPAKRSCYWKYYLLIGWFFGLLLPVVSTAEGIPHGLRGIGVIPPVFILTALGLMWFAEGAMSFREKLWQKKLGSGSVWDWNKPASGQQRFYQFNSRLLKAVVALFFAALVLQAYFAYFVYAANSPENFYAFRSDLSPVGRYLVERCRKDSTYLVLDKFSVQTTDYITSDPKGNFDSPCSVPYVQVDPENSWELKGLKAGDQIVFTQSSIFDIKKFKAYHPETKLVLEVRNQFGQAAMAVYEVK
ncbi:MAG: glycosyltransferase family 39 protein [Patescibacteria group bacterium]|nr:glycosyltransferase family 39 protein [Patescibacteria group bacterium]